MTTPISKLKLLAVCATFTLITVACGGSDDNNDNDENPGGTSNPVGGDNGQSNGQSNGGSSSGNTPANFIGTWVQDCTADDPSDPDTEYATTEVVLESDTATAATRFYIDSGCTIPSSPAEAVVVSSIVFTGGTTSTALGTASHLNATPESASIDGQAVTGTMAQLIGLNQTDYDIVLVANDLLYNGDMNSELDGSTPELRPTTLDTEDVLTRQ